MADRGRLIRTVPRWSLVTEDRRRRTLKGLAAAGLSALVPGLGQLVVRAWFPAVLLLATSAAVGAAAVWAASEPVRALELVLLGLDRPWLHAGNGALLVLRLLAAVHAYVRGARPPAIPVLPRSVPATLGTGVAWVLLLAVVLGPHAVASYATVRSAEVVDAVFAGQDDPLDAEPQEAVDPEPAPEAPTSVPATPPSRHELPEGPVVPSGSTNPWLDQERLTIAILGSDAGPERRGERLDTLMVASLDTESGDVVLVSVDRYLADFPLPDHLEELYRSECPFGPGWRYLNALYTCGQERIAEPLAELYPDDVDPAAAAVRDTLSVLLDVPIDHVALVDMEGFVQVVDALGGVELELATPQVVRMSPATEEANWRTIELPAGRQRLDGEEAIAYVRVRGDGGDAARMARQRCFAAGTVGAADAVALLRGFPDLADALENHLVTDLAVSQLPALLQLLLLLEVGPVVTEGFGPPEYRGGDHVPDVEAIRARMAELLAGEVDADLELTDGPTVCP